MDKGTCFSGQPVAHELLKHISKSRVAALAKQHRAGRYVKTFGSFHHLVVMLFATIGGYQFLREVTVGLLANRNKLQHLGLTSIARRSILSDANGRRSSLVFEAVYCEVHACLGSFLADTQAEVAKVKKLFAMDSTTISLFSDILKGAGRAPEAGKRKGGIKAHTVLSQEEGVPTLVLFTEAARHDHLLLAELKLERGSIITFDKGYVDYDQYARLDSEGGGYYVTRLKDDARYGLLEELDVPVSADPGVLKDEVVTLSYLEGKEKRWHKCRRMYSLLERGQL